MLYPQAIQIGRLLMYACKKIAVVSGRTPSEGKAALDCYADLDHKLEFHLEVPYRPRLSGMAFKLTRRFVPFYARIPDEFRAWVPVAERALTAKLAETGFRPDVIVTFGEPMSDHLLGLRLQRRLGLPWVAHFSDPWVDNPFRRRDVLANIVNARDEARTITAADRVIFTSVETRELVMRKFPEAYRKKAVLLPHSFDKGLYPAKVVRTGDIVVRHLGNFYGDRTPYPLLRGIHALRARNPKILDGVTFDLVGRVPQGLRWQALCRGLPSNLIKTTSTVSYSESLRLMSEADLLLVIDAPAKLSVFLPSKLIDYLGSGTPVMGIVPPGTSATLLKRLGGFIADPRHPDEVAAALGLALESVRHRRGAGETEAWGTSSVRDEFRPERTAAAFSEILRGVLDPSAPARRPLVVA